MFREHAPLIAVTAAVSLLFYLVFRDLRSMRSMLEMVTAAPQMATVEALATEEPDATSTPPALESTLPAPTKAAFKSTQK
jgi:glycerol-3-phosphate acyltransferase PlsY